MVDILIIILFIVSLVSGYRKGLVMQIIQLIGLIIAFLVAYVYYKPLAEKIVLWIPYPTVTSETTLKYAVENMDLMESFYRILAFAFIFFIVKFAIHIFASLFEFLQYVPLFGSINRVLGAVLGFIQGYIMIMILLYIFALLPIDGLQKYIDSSILTKLMLEYTPIISSMFQNIWYVYMK